MSDQDQLAQVQYEKQFLVNWMADLFDTMDAVLDDESKVKLFEGCGHGCFVRHSFKTDIAAAGKGDLAKLIEAYKSNFEIWQDGNEVHVRFGEVSPGCYCPVARNFPPKENDLHCECSRMTQQSIFEAAFGRPFKVDIVESVRRGAKTCHFIVHLD